MRKHSQQNDGSNTDINYVDKDYLNEGEEDQMEIQGYKRHLWYEVLSWIGIILSLGLLRLAFSWFPKFFLQATHRKSSLEEADKILIIDQYEKYKTYFVKKIFDQVIMENSKEINYSYTNQGFDGKKSHLGKKSALGVHEIIPKSVTVHFSNGYSKDLTEYRMIQVKKLRYIWVEEKGKFLKLTGIGPGMKQSDLSRHPQLNSEQQDVMRKIYGNNEIDVEVQSYFDLFIYEVSCPYYFFQLLSLVVWILDQYYYYAYAIIIITIFGILITIIQTHRAEVALKRTVQASESARADILLPCGRIKEIPSSHLVPGDRIVIPDNEEYTVPCDAVLLSGSCIVRESMLTGESVPLTKTVLPPIDDYFIDKDNANHMLFSGTKVIQTRRDAINPVSALVIRTGYVTAKGELIRAILYPPPVDFEFEQSVYTFINISAVAAFALAIGVALWLSWEDGAVTLGSFIDSFEILTMVIPAAIPGSLAVCKAYSLRRFHNRKIACINGKVINVAGSTNCVCFDKTGTITEDGLDIWGVVPAVDGTFQEPNHNPSSLNNDHLKFSLASCHSLSVIGGRILGDPLDYKMFESTGWIFEETSNISMSGSNATPVVHTNEMEKTQLMISLLHQNQFVSNLQRMSVITKQNQSHLFDLYCKGSPEMVASLSKTKTVPVNLDTVLQEYTKKGYRVLALGWRQLEHLPLDILKKKSRSDMELDLEFLGLLIMENKVKPASKPTIQMLKKGQFKITMITGDNMQTAISVSRECEIISAEDELIEVDNVGGNLICRVNKNKVPSFVKDPVNIEDGFRPYKLAMTGKAWELVRKQNEDFVAKALVRTAVFARMASKQKQQVVSELQAIGYCVAMCGDGANDCAALKASNVGISLSEGESSVASPIASHLQDISCVIEVIREGRSSLVASLGVIKYLLITGYIELISTMISYTFNGDLTDFQFVWQDIAFAEFLSITFILTSSYQGDIVPLTPVDKLLDYIPILSLAIFATTALIFQLISYYTIQTFSWYQFDPLKLPNPNAFGSGYTYNNYSLFSVAIFQYFSAAIVFSQGYPYRKPFYTNYLHVALLILLGVSTGLLITYPISWAQQLFELALPPVEFRYIVLFLSIVNFLINYLSEKLLIENVLRRMLNNLSWKCKRELTKYSKAINESTEKNWLSEIVQPCDIQISQVS